MRFGAADVIGGVKWYQVREELNISEYLTTADERLVSYLPTA